MKKILALLLAAAMCLTLLAACGSASSASDAEEETADTAQTETVSEEAAEEPAEETASAETGEPAEETPAAEATEQDITTVVIAWLDTNGKAETSQAMIDAVNAITEKEIGVHLEFKMFDFGNYTTSVSMMIAGGETLDIVSLTPIPGASFTTMYANGQLMDISSYLQEDYAQNAVALLGDYLNATTVSGGIYAMPAYRNLASGTWLMMRSDILEELGMKEMAENITTWEEVEEIFQAVTDNYASSGMYATSKGDTQMVYAGTSYPSTLSGAFTDGFAIDALGDSTSSLIGVADEPVSAVYSNETTIARFQKLAQWNEAGYIYPDSAIDVNNNGQALVKDGVSFSYFVGGDRGVVSTYIQGTGYEPVAVVVGSSMICSSDLQYWGTAVTVNAEEPEAAVKFMCYLYESADLMNLLTWGIEGTDYEVTDGIANYVNGDDSTAQWHGSDWLVGNQFLSWPWNGNDADWRETGYADTTATPVSPYLGFSLDTSDLSTEIAALTAVYDQYRNTLECGGYTESLYSEYASALQAAGIDSYVAAAQEQLDAWLAAR